MKKILTLLLLVVGMTAMANAQTDPNFAERQRVVNLWVDAAKRVATVAPQTAEVKNVLNTLQNGIITAGIVANCGMYPAAKEKIRIVAAIESTTCFREKEFLQSGQVAFYSPYVNVLFLKGEPNFQTEARLGIDLCKSLYLAHLQRSGGQYTNLYEIELRKLESLLLENLSTVSN